MVARYVSMILTVCAVAPVYAQLPSGPIVDTSMGEWWLGPVRIQGAFDSREAALRALFGFVWNDPTLANIVPRGDETLTVEAGKDGKLEIAWTGRTEFLSGAYVTLLDKSKKELKRHRFDTPPISFSEKPPEGARYYRLVLTYVNGAVTSFTAPLPAPAEEPEKKETKKADDSGLGGP
jgi:hypothetical protein